jgi:hypothetical protein
VSAEKPLAGLEPLVCLKLLTLHVGLPESAHTLDLDLVQVGEVQTG